MKLKVLNIEGNKNSDIELSDEIFSLNPNKGMIQLLIDWQMNHFKPRTAKKSDKVYSNGEWICRYSCCS